MKRRIIALVGAMTLTMAMSLNVAAAGSVTADKVEDIVNNIPTVEAPADATETVKQETAAKNEVLNSATTEKDEAGNVTVKLDTSKLDAVEKAEVKVDNSSDEKQVIVSVTTKTDSADTTQKAEVKVNITLDETKLAKQQEEVNKAVVTEKPADAPAEIKNFVVPKIEKATAEEVIKTASVVAATLAVPKSVAGSNAASATETMVVTKADVKAIVRIEPSTEGEATVAFTKADLGITATPVDGEEIWAIDGETGKTIVGKVVGDNVYFTNDQWSPYSILIVKVEKQAVAPVKQDQPPYNPKWDPTSPEYIGNKTTPTTTPVVGTPAIGTVVPVAVAPKTGDVAMMVSVMAVIFMAGAAVAVAQSKKRA